ncbi:MAG TPA: protein kinase, partial [Tepidisphaeraceae bacterium]
MTDRDSTEFATGDSREGAIQRILNRVIDARHAGDRCADDQIIREHPELLPELAERLQQLGQVQAARALADDDQTVPMLEGQLPLGLLADKIGAGSDLSAINADLAADPGEENHYRVLERLGKGGFGTVYKAEQRHPMRRVVAIKMITAGVDTPEVVARFESERQALARMDHPHIAKVFDAGSTRSGRPYFVMEYVPGEPITQFADRHKLTIAARLALFQQVCEAVNHAHMKSVIHRDIKAGNVLAYMHDGRPAAKVIDFGIAKALTGDRLTNQTFNTFHGQVIGTYESMSPEQAGGSPDVDTRTDVYSLGVLLYELLSGFKPLDSKMLFKAADAEIRRIICEVEPERPSTRLTSVGDAGSKIAAARQASIATLTQQFRRELEWIPLKAMRKERDRRYASPLQLAEDIRNYSEGKPLIAGPESGAYRFRKLLFRHKGAATALAGIAAALMIGVLLMLVGLSAARSSAANARISASKETAARLMAVQSAQDAGRQRDEATRQKGEAERQRDQATKQERIATQVNDFLSTMLASADPDKLLGDKVTVLQATDAAVKQLDAGTLNDQPLVESAIRTTMGRTLWALGRFDQAEPNLRKAVEISRKSLPPGHPDIAT